MKFLKFKFDRKGQELDSEVTTLETLEELPENFEYLKHYDDGMAFAINSKIAKQRLEYGFKYELTENGIDMDELFNHELAIDVINFEEDTPHDGIGIAVCVVTEFQYPIITKLYDVGVLTFINVG